LCAGADGGPERAVIMLSLITTGKLNDVEPYAWLAGVFARVAIVPQSRVHERLP
jgi:hypothetical protein